MESETTETSTRESATGSRSLDRVVGYDPPNDGRRWECQCARCGSSLEWISCEVCGGDGTTEPGDLYEQDPLWYDPDDTEPCHQCGGEAAWPACLSSVEWCEAHPLEGRAGIKPSTPEWYVVSNEKVSDRP